MHDSGELWHNRSTAQTLQALHTDASGLTSEQAEVRLLQLGPNRLPAPQPRSSFALLWDQVRSIPIFLLLASAGISFFTGGLVDELVIGSVLAINAVIGFATEKPPLPCH